jgi:hypothetical protein
MREAFSFLIRLGLAHFGCSIEAGLAPRQHRFTSSAEVRSTLYDGLEPGSFDLGDAVSVSSREFLVHGPQLNEASEHHYLTDDEDDRVVPFAEAVDSGFIAAPTVEVPDRPTGFDAERAILAGAWQSFWHDVREDALGSNHRPGTLTALVVDAKKEVSWSSPWWWGAYTLVLGSFACLALRVYYPVSPLPVAKRNDALINPSRRVNYVNPGYGVTGSRRVTAGPWRQPVNTRL